MSLERGFNNLRRKIEYKYRQAVFRKKVGDVMEREVVGESIERLQELSAFLLENHHSLRTLGAIDADFQLLKPILIPEEKSIRISVGYHNTTEVNSVMVNTFFPMKKEDYKCEVNIYYMFSKGKIDCSFVNIAGIDNLSNNSPRSGFICYIDENGGLKEMNADEQGYNNSTLRWNDGASRINFYRHTGRTSGEYDFTKIGEMDGKGVLVNVLRKVKKNQGGGGRDKKEVYKPNAVPEIGGVI